MQYWHPDRSGTGLTHNTNCNQYFLEQTFIFKSRKSFEKFFCLRPSGGLSTFAAQSALCRYTYLFQSKPVNRTLNSRNIRYYLCKSATTQAPNTFNLPLFVVKTVRCAMITRSVPYP